MASNLQPHRIRTFTFSPDPDFEARLLDVVGLYLNPPRECIGLCVDEKTGIQALDRTQPFLPLSAKKPRSWTNEYVRHGTQTLWAALEIASGQVVAHVKQRRTTVNFLRFLKQVIAATFPKRPYFQTSAQGIPLGLYRSQQRKSPALRMDQGPERLQRIIEATKQYQAAHPRKPRKRRRRNTINN